MKQTGKVYVVGIGPGSYEQMTIKAVRTLELSDIIVGYTVYVDLIREYFPGKELFSTPMMQEVDRCRKALEFAVEGKVVSVICSGDSGVYGMAGLVLELAEQFPEVEIEIVPGVTAASAGAAVLGAPICHDFAVISLSDLLTPKDLIGKRLLHAAEADMIICLYNPSSKKRADYLHWACELILQHRSADTVCGYVKQIGRDGQEKHVLTLEELKDTQVDMFTTVFIGNSRTKTDGEWMISPRGYRNV